MPLSRNYSSSVHLNSDGGDQAEANGVRNSRPASPPQTPSLSGIQQGDHNSDAPMSDEGDLEEPVIVILVSEYCMLYLAF